MKQIKMTLGFVLLTVGIITFTGCSKYEEGPGISLRTKKSRVAGEWKATSFKLNGVDELNSTYTDVFTCMSGNTFNYTNTGTMTIHWTFEKDGKSTVVTTSNYNALDYSNSYTQCSAIYAPGSDSSNETATWDFASNKEDLEITYSDGSKETWNIIELRSNEMKLKMTDGTDIYEVTLEQ